MARLMTDISNVKRGDRLFHENPPGSSFIVDRVVGVDFSSGQPGYHAHEGPGEHPYVSYRAGTQVTIDRRSIDELSKDELQAELDRRQKARQLRELADIREKLKDIIVDVRTIQREHWQLTSIEPKSFNADDILEAVFTVVVETQQSLEES